MMPFYQELELGFDIGAFGIPFKAKDIERAALCIENLAPLWRGTRMTAGARTPFAEQRERIVSRPIALAKARRRGAGAFAADRAHFPGRSMSGQSLLLVLRNRVFAHAGEEIV